MRAYAFIAIVAATLVIAAAPKDGTLVVPVVLVDSTSKAADETASHTVIDRRQLDEVTTDLPEVLDEQPGLRGTRLGGPGSFASIAIRGSTGDQVNVYLDGVPLNSSVGGPVDIGSVPLGPVERVVIYRGLSPLAFGASAMGGVVSVRTRTPATSILELRGGFGSFGSRHGRLFAGGGSTSWSGSVALDYQGSQGSFTYLNDGGTAFDTSDDVEMERSNNQVDNGTLMIKGKVALGSGFSIGATNFLTLKRHGVAGHGLHPTVAARLHHARNVSAFQLEGRKVGGTALELSVIPWATWSQVSFEDPLGEVGLGIDETRDRHLSTGTRIHAHLPIALDGELDWWITPQLAVELHHEIFTAGGSGVVAGKATDSHRTRLSAGAGLELAMEPLQTDIIGSIRHESSWSMLVIPENRVDLTREPPRNTAIDALTWRVALAQRSIPDVKLTANVSKSVRMPSLFELFGNTGAVLGNPSLKPESGWNVDAGAIYRPSFLPEGNTWSLELYGFLNEAENRIQFVRTSQGVSVAQNIASSTIYGLEVGTYLDVLGHVRARGSISWMPAINKTPVPAYEGKQLPSRPRWKGYVRVETYYPVSLFGGGEVGCHLDVEALTKNYDDLANLIEFPERVLLGAGVYMSFLDRQFRVNIDGENLTDAAVQDFIGHPHPGFSLMASIAWTPASERTSEGGSL